MLKFAPSRLVATALCLMPLGCPTQSQSQNPDGSGGQDSTGATDDGPVGTSDDDAADSGSDGTTTSAADSTGDEPPAQAQCTALDRLSFDQLLAGPPPGSINVGDTSLSVAEVEIASVDGGLALVAIVSDTDFLVVAFDETETPTGEVQWITGSTVYAGPAAVDLDDATDGVVVGSSVLQQVDGEQQVSISACFVVGAGSSRIELDGSIATLDGTLGSLTFAQVEAIVDERPAIDTLVVSDVPGSINDEVNVETGRMVRAAGWSTVVPADGVIASGGVDLFCAGAARSIEPGAQLGVHSWSDGTMDGADYPPRDPAHDAQLAYFTEMLGAPTGPDFYWFTLQAAPADSIHWMTNREIETHQLVTR
ncbi:MAG: hypothetical protein AAF721_00670 [Myxococcota bacterium]